MVVPVQAVLPDVVADLIRKSPLSQEKVVFAWSAAVGPAVARATTVTLRNGVLHVGARDSAWQREVTRSRSLIVGRLEKYLGPGVVHTLKVSPTR